MLLRVLTAMPPGWYVLRCHHHSSPTDWKMSDRTVTRRSMPSARFSGWTENGQALFIQRRSPFTSDSLPQLTGQHLLPNKQKSRKQRVSRKRKSGLRAQHKSQWGRGWDPPTSSKQFCKFPYHQYLTSRPVHLVSYVSKHLCSNHNAVVPHAVAAGTSALLRSTPASWKHRGLGTEAMQMGSKAQAQTNCWKADSGSPAELPHFYLMHQSQHLKEIAVIDCK